MRRREFFKAALAVAAGLWKPRLWKALSQTSVRRTIHCPILMYHYVGPLPTEADRYRRDLTVEPALFQEHCAYLVDNGYSTVNLAQLYAALSKGQPLPEKPVILTFDDGYAGMATYATPILQSFNLTGTFFVVQNFMGMPGYLTWDEAAGMLNAGMEIENHSATHADLREQDEEMLMQQIEGPAQVMEAMLGRRPRFYCYPAGRFDDEVVRILQATDHLMAVTTNDGTLHSNRDLYRLKRCRIRNTTGVESLAWLINRYL